MKRKLLCSMILAVMLTACGNDTAAASRANGNNANSVEAVLQQQMADATQQPEPTVEIVVDNPSEDAQNGNDTEALYELTGDPDPAVDVDLTVMNSNMVYAEVYNMMVQPTEYIGKSIKMRGSYNVFEDDATHQIYYTCIIQDATACCAQGIEFVPEDLDAFRAAGYASGDEITVEGEFQIYPDGEYMYAVLVDTQIL